MSPRGSPCAHVLVPALRQLLEWDAPNDDSTIFRSRYQYGVITRSGDRCYRKIVAPQSVYQYPLRKVWCVVPG